MPMQSDTCVLIAGGGPVGLCAAIELGCRGIPAILVTEKLDTAQHPKCNSTNARSMEHFRRLGIANELRAAALPPNIVRASAYVTRFCGYEFGRLPRPYSDWPTPEIPLNISQIVLEQRLRAHAQRAGGIEVHFGCKLVSFEAGLEGVVATVEDTSGAQRLIRASYLIGADGASSTVRRALGFDMIGEDGSTQRAFMGGTMLSYYVRAPQLIARSGRVPTHSTWIINPQMRGLMFSQDGKETWVAHYQVPPGVDWTALDDRAIVRQMLGADVAFEIISGGPWTGGLALVAEHYQAGNVFLVGDAAHLFTPLGGMGMNTGIGDVMNLCWKIAAMEEGWGGPGLLASYEIERRPIGLRNSQFGVKCSRVMDGWTVPANLEDDTPEAQKARTTLGAQVVVEDVPQYLSAGLQLGEIYEGSPIVARAETPLPEDRWDIYTPLDRSGARAPHFWLDEGRSLYDLFGNAFTLLTFAGAETGGIEAAAAARNVPLSVARLAERNPLYTKALVLVRPDQHIAWQADVADRAAAEALIDRIRGAVTDGSNEKQRGRKT
jgi:2-polyprenyl-6-methoxyphenol hydroxylase-like FAD-dependent oxidoreductase